jgi:CO/xanthine dehydrogenase Mo-binding subunit
MSRTLRRSKAALKLHCGRNYSGYLIPTNADIPVLDILFDGEASPLGAKGLGELTALAAEAALIAPGWCCS